jgi:hypothetical protein
MLAVGISLITVDAKAETLNPEGVNPHAEAPRKKISHEQKQAAAAAMKKRKAEIEARKAAAAGQNAAQPAQDLKPAATDNGVDNAAK